MTPTRADAVGDVAPAVPGRGATAFVRIGIGLAALVMIGREAGGSVPRFAQRIDGLGPWGSSVFAVGYAVVVARRALREVTGE
jgi:hypothetical protein